MEQGPQEKIPQAETPKPVVRRRRVVGGTVPPISSPTDDSRFLVVEKQNDPRPLGARFSINNDTQRELLSPDGYKPLSSVTKSSGEGAASLSKKISETPGKFSLNEPERISLGELLRKKLEENLQPNTPDLRAPRVRPSSFDEQRRSNERERRLEQISFESVYLEEVLSKDGVFQGYKSSALGRKKIVLEGGASAPLIDTAFPYTLKVIADSNPDDPVKGVYTVQIVPDSQEKFLLHREAGVARASRLRTSHGFKVLAKMINTDPDLSAEYRPMVARHDEFKRGLQQSERGERHRNFTPMIAGILMSDRGRTLFNQVIDRTVRADSLEYKAAIEKAEKPVYVPGIVVGSGVYSAVLANTRQMYLPSCPDLTFERSSKIGGQFSNYDSPLFRLNSRNRPELRDKPHLPGKEQSLNSSGNFGVVHQADISGLTYGDQTSVSDPARVNFFLSGRAVTDVKVSKVRRNYDDGNGLLIVESVDTKTGKVYEVATDRVTFATGVGDETDRLDRFDETTQTILKEEKESFEKTGQAKVFSATQFYEKVADPSNPFPLQGVKRLILSGSGDSGNVVAGLVLGYETQVGKTTKQLDNIEEIIWLGQSVGTKEEFLRTSRARYSQLGLEFPREQYEGYYSRIKPYGELRSSRLRRGASGQIEVIATDGFYNDPQTFTGDCYVYAHGFEDTTDTIVEPVGNTVLEGDELRGIGYCDEGDEIYFKNGGVRRIEVLKRLYKDNMYQLAVRVLTDKNFYEEKTIPEKELLTTITSNRDSIRRIEKGTRKRYGLDLEVVEAPVRGVKTRIAKQYTFDNKDIEIFKVGPAAGLEVSDQEIEDSPVLGDIDENAVAIFRYVDRVEGLSRLTAARDLKKGRTSSSLYEGEDTPQVELPDLTKPNLLLETFKVSLPPDEIEKISLTDRTPDLFKLAIGDIMSGYLFPSSLKEIKIQVRKSEGEGQYEVVLSPRLSFEYTALLTKVLTDSLVGGVIQKVTSNSRLKSMDLVIPIKDRVIDSPEITFKIPR